MTHYSKFLTALGVAVVAVLGVFASVVADGSLAGDGGTLAAAGAAALATALGALVAPANAPKP